MINVNAVTETFRARAEDLLRDQLAENERPPTIESLARYLSEELATTLTEALLADEEEDLDKDYDNPHDDPFYDEE